MTKAPIWIGERPKLVCSAFKKYLVLQPWQLAVRIQFRFETVWCIREGYSLLLKNGELYPITQVHIPCKCLIGKNDPYQTGLDYSEDSKAFRKALDERNVESGRKQIEEMLKNEA